VKHGLRTNVHVSVFQSNLPSLTPKERIEHLRQVARTADTDLLVCPELFLSGYAADEDIPRYAEPVDGPSSQDIASVARETSTTIVYGYPEAAGGRLYNAALCIGADGSRLGNHRKLTIPPGFEGRYFTPGSGLTVFSVGDLRLALLICYDAEFPEAVRACALAGAQVIVAPTALSQQWASVSEKLMPTRAFENGVYLLYANHAGREGNTHYLGSSCIISPDGRDLARADREPTIISATVDTETVARAQKRLPYLADLPALHQRLRS